MNIQQGDNFTFLFPNGATAYIEVTSTLDNQIAFRHTNGRSAKDSIHEDYFIQLVKTGYFKAVE
ncbi:hypothetical protein [Salinicoccus sp. HZC-1]|uniref:hypothetical protein n=1 Tax=Salinicoccus sp. HZC-1 TaxID=3385497 RepID=UPI00398B4805